MSRLDYVTIAIVAVCVAALIYLIYMTTNLIGDSGEPETTTETTVPADNEDAGDDTYYFNDEGKAAGDEPGAGTDDADTATPDNASDYDYQNGQGQDTEGASSSSTPATSTPAEPDTRSPAAAEEEYTSRSGSTTSSSGSASTASGSYLVIAGTFKEKANAEVMERKLKGLGYNNASLEPFDRGAYTVVLVDRFGSANDAKALVSALKGKGVEAYVKRN